MNSLPPSDILIVKPSVNIPPLTNNLIDKQINEGTLFVEKNNKLSDLQLDLLGVFIFILLGLFISLVFYLLSKSHPKQSEKFNPTPSIDNLNKQKLYQEYSPINKQTHLTIQQMLQELSPIERQNYLNTIQKNRILNLTKKF